MPDTVQVNDGTGSKISTDEVTTVDGVGVTAQHAQRVKVGHGSDGVFDTIKAASPLEVRLYGAGGVAASFDSDRLQVKAVTDQLPSSLGVGGALNVIGQDFNVDVGLWNGTGADGARTTTYSSANQTNKWARGLVIHLHVTAVGGGSDTIKLRVNTKGVYGTGFVTWESAPISATTDRVFFLYPGTDPTYMPAGLQVGAVISVPLAKTFNVAVVHSGATSFTYDLSYSLVQ